MFPIVFFAALFVCSVGLVSSCETDCEKRGGVLLRTAHGGYVCFRGERIR